MSIDDRHDERTPRTVYFQRDIEDLKERVTRLETSDVDRLRARVETLTKAMRVVIDDGLYQPQSADVLENALNGVPDKLAYDIVRDYMRSIREG